jgi:Predicted endonuclease containing a URI domain
VGRKFSRSLGITWGAQNTGDDLLYLLFYVVVFYIYILYSPRSDRYYIGLTTDVNRRLEEHNHPPINKKYTAKHLPWELKLFFECSESRGEVLLIERFIKNQKSRIFVEKLISEKDNPEYFKNLINNIMKK